MNKNLLSFEHSLKTARNSYVNTPTEIKYKTHIKLITNVFVLFELTLSNVFVVVLILTNPLQS